MSTQPPLASPLPTSIIPSPTNPSLPITNSPTTPLQPTNPTLTIPPDSTPATKYLNSLISRTLRVSTSDARLFLGELKCTDREGNVILGRCFEYRIPPPPGLASSTLARGEGDVEWVGTGADVEGNGERGAALGNAGKVRREMKSERYIGLVVIPGRYIRKIEVEEFESQTRGGSMFAKGII